MHRIKNSLRPEARMVALVRQVSLGEAHLSSDFIDRVKGVMYWLNNARCGSWLCRIHEGMLQ